MRKVIFIALSLISIVGYGQGIKISALPQAVSLSGSEVLPIVQSGITKKTTVQSISSLGGFWKTTGNAGTDPATNFIGTSDLVGLKLATNNVQFAYVDSLQNTLIGHTLPNNYDAKFYSAANFYPLGVSGIGFDYYRDIVGIHAFSIAGDYSGLGGDSNEVSTGIINFNTGDVAVSSVHYNGGSEYEAALEVMTGGYTSKVLVHDSLTLIATNGTNIYGNLRIQNGTQGSNKVLTSNASGLASWQNPHSLRIVSSDLETLTDSSNGGTVLINNSSNAWDFYIPSAASVPAGFEVTIGKLNSTSTGAVTVNTLGGVLQDLSGTYSGTFLLADWGNLGRSMTWVADGNAIWYLKQGGR